MIHTEGGERYLFGLTLFRFGLHRFERRLNALLDDGWELDNLWYTHLWFRLFIMAKLSKPLEPEKPFELEGK